MLSEFRRDYNTLYDQLRYSNPDDEEWFYPKLFQLTQKYHSSTVVEFAKQENLPASTFEYLTKAGFRRVDKSILLELANGMYEDQVYAAILSLAICGYEEGFELLKQFATKTHKLSKAIDPLVDVLPDLKYISKHWANELTILCKNYTKTLFDTLLYNNEVDIIIDLLPYYRDKKELTPKEVKALLDFPAYSNNLNGLIGLLTHNMPRILLGKVCSNQYINQECQKIKHTLKDLEAIADIYLEEEHTEADCIVFGEVMLNYPREKVDENGNLLE